MLLFAPAPKSACHQTFVHGGLVPGLRLAVVNMLPSILWLAGQPEAVVEDVTVALRARSALPGVSNIWTSARLTQASPPVLSEIRIRQYRLLVPAPPPPVPPPVVVS